MLIEILIPLILVLCFFYFFVRQKLIAPFQEISNHVRGLKLHPIPSWRQIKQSQRNSFSNEMITTINELIFQAQRSFVCQENLGRFLAHEIKTPLTNLMNEIETVRMDLPKRQQVKGEPIKDEKEVCKAEHSESKEHFYQQAMNDIFRIRSIVNNICELAFIEKGERGEEETDLLLLLKESITEFEHVYKTKIEFESDIGQKPCAVWINPDYFWVLFSNILRNSLKHGNGHKIPPRVKILQQSGKYKIEFSDSGPGLPFSREIFESFSTGNDQQACKLHGVGLVLCLRLSEIMNLAIDFDNQPAQGAVVNVWFEYARN